MRADTPAWQTFSSNWRSSMLLQIATLSLAHWALAKLIVTAPPQNPGTWLLGLPHLLLGCAMLLGHSRNWRALGLVQIASELAVLALDLPALAIFALALLTPLAWALWLRPGEEELQALQPGTADCLAYAAMLALVLCNQGRSLADASQARMQLPPLQLYLAHLMLAGLPAAALLQAMAVKCRSLQRYAHRLQGAQAELRELNQALEARVAHRTAELERLATTDALTDTHNRRFLMARAEIEIALARRNGHAVSLVMFDIDHFKHINDSHGHNVGDRVLVALTQAIKQEMRTGDTFARIGGEEFVMLLPHVEADQAWQVAERLRSMIEALVIKASRGLALHITASFGVATLSPRICTVDALCVAADAALYQAKAAGRNCVVADLPTAYSS